MLFIYLKKLKNTGFFFAKRTNRPEWGKVKRKYFRFPMVLGLLLLSAALPANAITQAQKQQLSAELNQYAAYFQNQQYKEIIDKTPPTFWAAMRKQMAQPVDAGLFKSAMEDLLRSTFEEYQIQSVHYDLAHIRSETAPSGRLYVLVPYHIVFMEKSSGQTVTENSRMLVVQENNQWFMLRGKSLKPVQSSLIRDMFPDLPDNFLF